MSDIVNAATGVGLDLLPVIIAGGVLLVALVVGILVSNAQRKKKQREKAARKAARAAADKENGDSGE
ncbi:MAG: hypothetical protein NC203_09670 [Firmicutes bacterium]|nr:hypothetical protein [[Eubacterium] siraeum]MCM1488623.1 hypothetical protein [Bacillota bacterium]